MHKRFDLSSVFGRGSIATWILNQRAGEALHPEGSEEVGFGNVISAHRFAPLARGILATLIRPLPLIASTGALARLNKSWMNHLLGLVSSSIIHARALHEWTWKARGHPQAIGALVGSVRGHSRGLGALLGSVRGYSRELGALVRSARGCSRVLRALTAESRGCSRRFRALTNNPHGDSRVLCAYEWKLRAHAQGASPMHQLEITNDEKIPVHREAPYEAAEIPAPHSEHRPVDERMS